MSKKILSLLTAALMVFAVFCFAGCEDADTGSSTASGSKNPDGTSSVADVSNPTVSKDDFKIGIICLHDENSTYDKNFLDAAKAMQQELGLKDEQVLIKTNIPESDACETAAMELAEEGCNVIFADSFGHEDFMMSAAMKYPNVQFCHATGTKAHTANIPNFHNAFASIYEGRYLAGIVAGLKLNEMIQSGKITAEQAKMGYVGAMPYAEVKSGYTSFYLGAKSVCPSVTMEVMFTSSWYDEAKEKEYANALINDGCVLISQHADSWGAPTACEEKGVPNVSYNGSTTDKCPKTALISSKINWAPYLVHISNAVMNGTAITEEFLGNLENDGVQITELNTSVAAAGTQEAIDAAKADIIAGKLHIFNTDTFTVGGKKLDSYKADVDSDANFEKDTEVIKDGYFHESEYRSAPYFDIDIDGITIKN